MRKLLGLLILVAMGNLSFAGSHVGCARHAGMMQTASDAPMPADHHHGDTGRDRNTCHFPSQADGCQGVASCGATLSLASALPSFDAPSDSRQHIALADALPLTRLVPPDPPPPKV